MADNVEIDGLVKEQKALEALMMSNPDMEKKVQGLIRKVLMTVRRAVAQQAKGTMKSDPRQAYKAVKTAVYRQILGGSVSILNKRRGSVQFSDYEPPRKLQAGQRGGNRRERLDRTQKLLHYAGADRGFILRFLNAGTADRGVEFTYNESRKVDRWNKHPNTGNRGRIRARNFFSTSSHQAMRKASEELTHLIDQLIKESTR
jgi:hypothetical protein